VATKEEFKMGKTQIFEDFANWGWWRTGEAMPVRCRRRAGPRTLDGKASPVGCWWRPAQINPIGWWQLGRCVDGKIGDGCHTSTKESAEGAIPSQIEVESSPLSHS
jgi:hypothetical protein